MEVLSDFKKQVNKDIGDVFFNANEFAKVVNWNGREITVIDDIRINMRYQNNLALYEGPGINAITKTYILKRVDFPALPVVTEEVRIDGVTWYIQEIKEQGMFLSVLVERMVA